MRKLGIPTVVDRLIQQAILQVLGPIYDSTFSESSYGFRPKRGAHDGVLAAREHVAGGRRWVVDLDLEKFFDRVNHDVLMSRVARRIGDKILLRTIRSYLAAGVMANGIEEASGEGTPQGGPLSPLLSNILLDELDLDGWLRRKLRCILWRQWKRGRTRFRRLVKTGIGEDRARMSAWNGRGAWWNSGASHMNEAFPKKYFDSLGLVSLLTEIRCFRITSRTAVYGTVRTVV